MSADPKPSDPPQSLWTDAAPHWAERDVATLAASAPARTFHAFTASTARGGVHGVHEDTDRERLARLWREMRERHARDGWGFAKGEEQR